MATDLKAQLSKLIELQKIDTEIYVLRGEKTAKPQEIKVLEIAFEDKKKSLAELEKKLLDAQKQRKDKELELGSKEEANKKLQGQLFSLKTNNEYQAMLKQIADGKADASLIEDKILQLFEEVDRVRQEVEAEKGRLKIEEQNFFGEKKKVDDRIREIDQRITALEAQKKQSLPDIEPRVLAQYEKILASREGLAIVGVKNNTCKGCNMHVTPQMRNLIKMYENIVTCEFCNRILYVDSET